MEGGDQNNVEHRSGGGNSGGGCGGGGNSRWNPTKEQINMLEGLYMQGIRTPSADQIQQITSRLKVYGHIEGKNVFYWFQNHKARQRQKQKQEKIALLNRFYRNTPPMYHAVPPTQNVCGPYYPQPNDSGFYAQCPKMFIPGGFRRMSKAEKFDHQTRTIYNDESGYTTNKYNHIAPLPNHYNNEGSFVNVHDRTLPLFPLEPTSDDNFHGRNKSVCDSSYFPASTSNMSNTIGGYEYQGGNGGGDQPFFDFL